MSAYIEIPVNSKYFDSPSEKIDNNIWKIIMLAVTRDILTEIRLEELSRLDLEEAYNSLQGCIQTGLFDFVELAVSLLPEKISLTEQFFDEYMENILECAKNILDRCSTSKNVDSSMLLPDACECAKKICKEMLKHYETYD